MPDTVDSRAVSRLCPFGEGKRQWKTGKLAASMPMASMISLCGSFARMQKSMETIGLVRLYFGKLGTALGKNDN
jgi:hypothetical protein